MSAGKKIAPRRAKNLALVAESIEASSGNVFADLGLPDAEELLVKADLALNIRELVEQNGWTNTETARRAGVSQSELSNLLRGRLPTFSVDLLSAILSRISR